MATGSLKPCGNLGSLLNSGLGAGRLYPCGGPGSRLGIGLKFEELVPCVLEVKALGPLYEGKFRISLDASLNFGSPTNL